MSDNRKPRTIGVLMHGRGSSIPAVAALLADREGGRDYSRATEPVGDEVAFHDPRLPDVWLELDILPESGARRARFKSGEPSTFVEKPAAVKRVKNPIAPPLSCRYCGSAVRLRRHSDVYGRNHSEWPLLYCCLDCGARVGVHPQTFIPLGTLADKALRDLRQHVKQNLFFVIQAEKFDGSRGTAYRWLAYQLGIPVEECHFGWFDGDELERVSRICVQALGELNERGQNNGKR